MVIPDCPFCNIVKGLDPHVREVWRNRDFVAFFPTDPAVIGHTLLIPRVHVPTIWQLNSNTAKGLGIAVRDLARAINDAFVPEGLNIIQSNGIEATQTVQHVHVHLVPRWEDDQMGNIWPDSTNYTESAKDEAWKTLRNECLRTMV